MAYRSVNPILVSPIPCLPAAFPDSPCLSKNDIQGGGTPTPVERRTPGGDNQESMSAFDRSVL